MAYVEVHPVGDDTFRIVIPGEDRQPVVNATFIEPMLGELGVRTLGPWEDATDTDGHDYRRALLVS